MIEIHRNLTEWIYRINEHDDRHPYGTSIQRRKLAKGSRWEEFLRCDTAQMAREIILVFGTVATGNKQEEPEK